MAFVTTKRRVLPVKYVTLYVLDYNVLNIKTFKT